MTARPDDPARGRLLSLVPTPSHDATTWVPGDRRPRAAVPPVGFGASASGGRGADVEPAAEPGVDATGRAGGGDVEAAGDPEGGAGVDTDADDLSDRWRAGALARVGDLYAGTYGHPLAHGAAPRRRWAVPLRAALGAALAVGLVGGAVAAHALAAPDTAQVAEPLPEVAGPDGDGTQATPTAAGQTTADASASEPGAQVAGGGTATTDAAVLVVHVVGQVVAPGVVRLAVGSRVADAVEAAGGPTEAADLAALNLARVLVDGEQVHVPRPGELPVVAPDAQVATSPGQGASTLLDLNAADVAALDALPGIGPVLAERVVSWRTEHGRFTDVEELGEVSGIGPTLLGRLRPLVRV